MKQAPRFVKNFMGRLSEDDMKRFLKKGVFPYKWFHSYATLDYQNLPRKDFFGNDLTNSQIDDEDYGQAVWV